MKLIVTGCDLTGKTTLINKIIEYKKDHRLSYLHFSYRDRRDYLFYNTMLDKDNFIADRHFIDEKIYYKVFNRECQLNDYEFYELINRCRDNDIKVIILTVSEEELLKRSRQRQEEKEVVDNLLKINKSYINIANRYGLKLFDTSKNSFEEIINYIES